MTHGTILVIEDGDEDFDLLQISFKAVGITNTVARARDADEAFTCLHQGAEKAHSPHSGLPIIIILDLNLGASDGRDVLQQIRATDALRAIPIMVLSTSNNPRDVKLCYASGANCYALKPIGLEKLENLVRQFKHFWLDTAELPNPELE